MSHTEKNSLTRRELLKTAGKATAVVVASPLVELAFGGAKAPVTTALFSAPGEYVVQMAADNGTAKATSTLIVKVELPPPPEQLRFVVTRPYAVTGPFWAPRVKALITSWIPYCIDQ